MNVIRNLSAAWNHHEVMHVINPKERYTLTRDAIPSQSDEFHTPHFARELHTNPSDWIKESRPIGLLDSNNATNFELPMASLVARISDEILAPVASQSDAQGGAERGQRGKRKKKSRPIGLLSFLAPPAGLEPATP